MRQWLLRLQSGGEGVGGQRSGGRRHTSYLDGQFVFDHSSGDLWWGEGGESITHSHTLTHESCMRKKNLGAGGGGGLGMNVGVGGAEGGRLHHRFDKTVWFVFAALRSDATATLCCSAFRKQPQTCCVDSGTRTTYQCVGDDAVWTVVH